MISNLKEWVTYNNDGWLKGGCFCCFFLRKEGKKKNVDLSTDIIDTYLDQGYNLLRFFGGKMALGEKKKLKKGKKKKK